MEKRFDKADMIRSFLTGLLIGFVALKLAGIITWSWLWVLAPLWMTAIVIIAFILVLFIVNAVVKHQMLSETEAKIINDNEELHKEYLKKFINKAEEESK